MRSYNFCHTNTKNPGNNLGIFCLITGRPKLNGYPIIGIYKKKEAVFGLLIGIFYAVMSALQTFEHAFKYNLSRNLSVGGLRYDEAVRALYDIVCHDKATAHRQAVHEVAVVGP